MKALVAVLGVFILVGSAGADGVVRLRLRPQLRAVDVELDVPLVDPGMAFVELPFVPQRFARAGGLEQFVKLLDDANTVSPLPWTGRIDHPGARLHIRYRVLLEHVAAQPVAGIDQVPHATSTGWSLIGRALVPNVRVTTGEHLDMPFTVEVSVDSPMPKRWLSNLLPAPGPAITTITFIAPSFAALRDATFYWGEFFDETLTADVAGAPTIQLVSSDFGAADLGGIRSLLGRSLRHCAMRHSIGPSFSTGRSQRLLKFV